MEQAFPSRVWKGWWTVFDAQPTSGEALSAVQEAQQDHDELARLGEQLCREAAHLAAAECRWLLRLAEFDRRGGWGVPGARSCAHWLGWACGLGPEAARERVRVARGLPGLPQVTAAFAAGELSFSKVRAVTRVATPETEAVLVDVAKSPRRRSSSGWWPEGMVRISARLPAEDGAQVIAALRAYQRRLDASAKPSDGAGDDVSAEPSNAATAGVSAECPGCSARADSRRHRPARVCASAQPATPKSAGIGYPDAIAGALNSLVAELTERRSGGPCRNAS